MPDVTGSNFAYTRYLIDSFKGGVHQPETHSLRIGLLRSSYTPDKAHIELADVSADEAFGNGYSRQTPANVVIAQEGNWVTMTFDPVQFSAAGGNYSFKHWFLYNDTAPNNPLMVGGQCDINRDDEIVLVDGKTFDLVVNELGLYRIPV